MIPLEYDSLGCMKSSSSNGSEYNSTILIPQYNAVVVSQNGKYGLVDVRGNVILTCGADGIYSKTSNGKMSYWLVVQNNEMDLLDYLNKNYKPADTNENTEKQENNVQNTTEQNVNGQTVQNQSGQEGQSTTQNTAAQNAQNGLQNGQVTNQTTNNGQGTAGQQTANPQQSTN